MDFGWTPEETAIRARARQFLDANWSRRGLNGRLNNDRETVHEFERTLAEHGWLTMAWPSEYGGQSASYMAQMIFKEEATIRGAPNGGMGAAMVGPMLMIHGS